MDYEYKSHKIVAVLSSDIEMGVALNVIGHLSVALGAHVKNEDLMGRPYLKDASGGEHRGIARYPYIVTKVKPNRLKQLVNEARKNPAILIVDYPLPMLTTGHDDELAGVLASMTEEQISYLGVVLFGPYDAVSLLTGKFSLWR